VLNPTASFHKFADSTVRSFRRIHRFVVTQTVTTKLDFPSRIESVEQAAQAAAEFVARLQLGDEAAYGFDMAVREAVTNAVIHGNKQDETKQVEVLFTETPEQAEIAVRDYGTGFDLANVPDPTVKENLMKTNGRGILFMNTFMDAIKWEKAADGGTVVRMTKNRI